MASYLIKPRNFAWHYYLLAIGLGLYIQVDQKLLSPPIVSLALVLALMASFFDYVRLIKIERKRALLIAAVALYASIQSISNVLNDITFSEGLSWWIILLFFISLIRTNKHKHIINGYYLYHIASLTALFFDLYLRLDGLSDIERIVDGLTVSRYLFKNGGAIGGDSNFAAMFALVNLSLIMAINYRGYMNLKERSIFVLYIVFVIFSFSVSVIVVTSLSLGFFFIARIFGNRRAGLISLLLTTITLPFLLLLLSQDSSGLSKLYIWKNFINEYTGLTDFFFGQGIGNARIGSLNYGAHSTFIQLLLEAGFFAFLSYIGMFFILYIISGNRALYIIIPFSVAGLSFGTISAPYLIAVFVFLMSASAFDDAQLSYINTRKVKG
jgi:hypothetical protein